METAILLRGLSTPLPLPGRHVPARALVPVIQGFRSPDPWPQKSRSKHRLSGPRRVIITINITIIQYCTIFLL